MCVKMNYLLWIESIKYWVAPQYLESFALTLAITASLWAFKNWLHRKMVIIIDRTISQIQQHVVLYNNIIIFKGCGLVKHDLREAAIHYRLHHVLLSNSSMVQDHECVQYPRIAKPILVLLSLIMRICLNNGIDLSSTNPITHHMMTFTDTDVINYYKRIVSM